MKKPPKTILVTGCAGFIGSNFVRQFKKESPRTRIVGIDNLSTGRKDALHPSLTFYKGSITDKKLLDRVFKKHRPEFVFHFAALPRVSYSVEHPTETAVVNVVGTVALLEYAHKYNVSRCIYSASSSAYGNTTSFPTKETVPANPLSPYALEKYQGEMFCSLFSALYGLDTVSLRYFNVFGPGQYGDSPYATVMAAWLEALYFPRKNRVAYLEGDGLQSRDFCYIDNVVQANIRAMFAEKPLRGEVFNVATGTEVSLRHVHLLIEKITGKKIALEHRPSRKGDVRRTKADIEKTKRVLGYRPQIFFEEGLAETIRWFEKRVNKK